MMQKMRRYIKAFAKDDEKETEGMEKTDPTKGLTPGTPKLRQKKNGFGNTKRLSGWNMIRQSALSLQMEQEKLDEDQDIKYV